MIQMHIPSLIIGFVVGNVFGMIVLFLLSMHFTNGDDNDDTGTY